MSGKDRRIDPRLNIRVPLRVRLLNEEGSPELSLESENVSQRGIFFESHMPLEVGTPIEVTLRMPEELAGQTSHEVKCIARVVHVHSGSLLGGKIGIGVHIERYVLDQDRWAN